ncbi:MAG: hypothetical protein IKO06_06130 [Alphaproteobacteria bacterium]|nr:hypothetical protein [Alphaproteobacteria bacterium]
MKNFEIKNQNGRSMIEMLGVLAIIGMLSVGGIAGYSKAMMKYRINKTIEQITLIAGNVRTFFAPQKNYRNLSTNVIKKAKLVPDEMWNEDKTALVNAFGDSFSIFGGSKNTATTSDDKAFIISLSGLPAEACIELATHNWQIMDNVIAVVLANMDQFTQYGALDGCAGIDDPTILAGCANGITVGLPLPIEKVANVCETADRLQIKFR